MALGEIRCMLHVATHLNMSDFLTKIMESVVWRRWIDTGLVTVEPGKHERAAARKALREAADQEQRRRGLAGHRVNKVLEAAENLIMWLESIRDASE